MKYSSCVTCTTIILLLLFLPCLAPGQEKANYVTLKAGAYFPSDDLDDDDFDTGFNGEIAIGHYFNQNFILEGSIGYFVSDASESGFVPGLGLVKAEAELDVVPVSLTAKAVYPLQEKAELYAGVGVGVYFVDIEISGEALGIKITDDDDDAVVGANLGVGFNYNITDVIFLGVEGKYILTDEVDGEVFFVSFDGHITGFTLTGNVGLRF